MNELLSRLAPAVPCAAEPRQSPIGLRAMLDAVDYGVMSVRSDCVLLFANRVARRYLRDDGTIHVDDGGRVGARHPRDADSFKLAVKDAVQRGLQRLLFVGDAASGMSAIAVTPIPAGPDAEAAAMVSMGRPSLCSALAIQATARLHGLTSAEHRVLAQLCAGRRPIAIARSQGVEISTVRTQIGSIRAKLGARDIVGVIAAMAVLPPLPLAVNPT